MKKKLNSVLSGVAGEYLVAGELTRKGFIAALTMRNSKGVDILVSNDKATKTIGIQVKTNQGRLDWWLLTEKAEDYFAKNLFYVFVNLNNGETPEFYIAPSEIVADFVKRYHRCWLKTPGRRGQKHNDTSLRCFQDSKRKYLNRWDLLNLK